MQARGQGIQGGEGGAAFGAERGLWWGAWPRMNVVIHKNSELLHSRRGPGRWMFIYLCLSENNICDAFKFLFTRILLFGRRFVKSKINMLSC